MKRLQLVRYGGLTPVKQKHYTTDYEEMTFHGAPERYGIYAFMFGHIDWFLLGGDTGKMKPKTKDYEHEFKNKRDRLAVPYKKFSVEGEIWTHIKPANKFMYMVTDERGEWYKMDADDFVVMYKKEYARMTAEANEMETHGFFCDGESPRLNELDKTIKSPYRYICKDHLEIFVPKGTTIKPF
ncbi:MAG: hypothetical protein DRH57_04800 [Candidatus Cloacimonadota bacterium]|nr:MAG: hypothetical protein DRH57_04800 [Candidatus Cloacimonadota bacterium]